ncbi:MAG: O-antigen translocase [Gallionella sp.]|nr:O-antigen translocase [Gallionella sp.]
MNPPVAAYRNILKTTSIIGGSSAINIAIGIIKVKVLAVLLGPAGVGLLGLYLNIMGMASSLAGCGLGVSGVRQLAAASGEEATLDIVRRTLWLANLILGFTGMLFLWLLREPVSQSIFGDIDHANNVGWLGIGVMLTLIAGSQTALLQGLRRIGDLARVNIISSVLGAISGILLVYWLGEHGVLWFVLTAPAISILVASYYAARLPRPKSAHDWRVINQQWQAMLKLGIPFMMTGLLGFATQLTARTMIQRELGLEATGYFHAAWAISMTYIGLVLSAMGADYYPRLTAVIKNHPLVRKMVNEQAEMSLLLAGPILLCMITFAPWVIHLLYAESFAPATEVLRWQVLGDVFKVASWPIGFILLAQGRGVVFILAELIWSAVYLGVIFLGGQGWGLVVAGVGFWIAYLIYFGLIAMLGFRLVGFKPAKSYLLMTLLLSFAGGLIMFSAKQSTVAGYAIGLMFILSSSIYSLHKMDGLLDLRGWLKQKIK